MIARRRVLIIGALAAAAACGGSDERRAAAPPPPNTAAEPTRERSVEQLPYLTWVPTARADAGGVVHLDRARAAAGLNLYSPRNRATAYLIDNAGGVIHSWRQDGVPDGWHHVQPAPDGGLLAIVKDQALFGLDWQSRVLWTFEARAHHDVALAEDGRIWLVSRKDRIVTTDGGRIPILDDEIVELGPDHRLRSEISMFDLFRSRIPPDGLEAIRTWLAGSGGSSNERSIFPLQEGTPADLMHLNSVEPIDRDISGFARRGDLLVSLRALDLVAVIDPARRIVRWTWGPGALEGQHHASLLANDHLLLFDNGIRRRSSRVVEVDPQSGRIVWQYPERLEADFYSYSRGGAQRLGNGNTLITESDSGRAFEVTATGRRVWEFLCPEVQVTGDPARPERAALYRVRRLGSAELRRFGIQIRLRSEGG